MLDPTLSFSRHVDYLISKSIERLKMLSKTRPVVTEETFLMLYKTLCAPIFDYCDIVYDCLTQRNIACLQKLQNSALCIIAQCGRICSVTELHQTYKLDTLANRRHKHCCHYSYKAINDMCPVNFCNMFSSLASRDCSVATRSVTNPDVTCPNYRLEFSRRSFGYRGPAYWNILDYDMKLATNFNQFKRLLNESDMFV